jgi:superfamily I DNA/RNA helicase
MPVISVRVDQRTYEALVKLAEARGVSLYSLVKAILEAQVSSEVSGEVSYRELERKLSELTSKVSYLEEKIQELLTSTASKTSSSQAEVGTANPSAQETHASGGYEWCRSKAKIRNLQSFLKWVDGSFGLIDWWDEGDKYCFKTRRKPAKTE